MFLGLCVNTIVGRHDKNCGICLACACDHVLHEVSVPGCIDDGEVVVRCVELLVCYVDGDSALSLFFQAIHYICQSEASFPRLARELLIFVDHVLFNVTAV